MAIKKSSDNSGNKVESTPKKTMQGSGNGTKCAATSRNKARKRYRSQGNG